MKFAWSFVFLLLAACATPYSSMTPKQQLEFDLGAAREALKSGAERASVGPLIAASIKPGGASEVVKLLGAEYADRRAQVIAEFSSSAPSVFHQVNADFLRATRTLSTVGIPEFAEVANGFERSVLDGLRSGSLNYAAKHDLPIAALQGADNLFDVLADGVINAPGKIEQIRYMREIKVAENHPARARLSGIDFKARSIPELRELDALGISGASEALSKRVIRVAVNVIPRDVLLEEDLRPHLVKLGDDIVVLGRNDDQGNADLTVEVEKLRMDVRQIPQQTQTISYAQYEVHFLAGALLMPKNATYIYEVVSGGVEADYGFSVTIRGGEKPEEHLVRAKIQRQYNSCRNQRIQNVFGGAQPADFVANDDMASRCNGPSTPVTVEEVAGEALAAIATRVGSSKALQQLRAGR